MTATATTIVENTPSKKYLKRDLIGAASDMAKC
jgi:hypothetical protein